MADNQTPPASPPTPSNGGALTGNPSDNTLSQPGDAQLLEMKPYLDLAPGITLREKTDRPAILVPPLHWPLVAAKLIQAPEFQFDMLVAHTAIDWIKDNEIELIYELYSTHYLRWLTVGVKVSREHAVSASVSSLWPIAEWQEREIFDLFGVRFQNHPDLRRLFLEDDWQGFPLLKDYKDEFMLERPW